MTTIIYDNVKRKYARLSETASDEWMHNSPSSLVVQEWVVHPADATAISEQHAHSLKNHLAKVNGPALDGSVEIREQINEVNKAKKNRYVDSPDYEDPDETDIA